MKRVFTTCADSDLLKSNFAQREIAVKKHKNGEGFLSAFSGSFCKRNSLAFKNELCLGGMEFEISKAHCLHFQRTFVKTTRTLRVSRRNLKMRDKTMEKIRIISLPFNVSDGFFARKEYKNGENLSRAFSGNSCKREFFVYENDLRLSDGRF
jgi:hypothetical protein